MKKMKIIMVLALLGIGSSLPAGQVTLETLLDEIINRDNLSVMPDPSYTCKQFSSYDRASRSRDDKGTWYANGDASKYIRTEQREGREEEVLFDAKGPGVIVRFWATWQTSPRNMLRIYIDGEETPAVEAPMADVIDGGVIAGAPLGEGVSPLTEYDRRGHNLYFPIPYGKSCKITYQRPVQGPLYYQINYRTYEDGTDVKSFRMDDLKKYRSEIAAVQRRLAIGGAEPGRLDEKDIGGVIKPGKSESVKLKGESAIREIILCLDARDREQALRSTVLEISFDGERSVWCPIGDFFGTGHQFWAHRTWFNQLTADGSMACHWVMPFKNKAEITLHNLGDQPVEIVFGKVRYGGWKWNDSSMYFHSAWMQMTKVMTQTNTGADHGAFDINYVTIKGEGVYVGDSLTVFNGAPSWWGEGDEKIFVDDEIFPSHFGTGTEDYYGYAWCHNNFFESPFHAQPSGKGNNAVQMSVNSRYRMLDAIPFKKSLEVNMELWHWARTGVNFAPVTFWYAKRGATSNREPDPETAALPIARKMEDVVDVVKEKGLVEAEGLKEIEKTAGDVKVQERNVWSGFKQLWWTGATPGDKLTVVFPVEKDGIQHAVLGMTRANDYAVVKISVDDRVVKESVDMYAEEVDALKVDLGKIDIKDKKTKVTVEITGMNEKAKKSCMVGVDYLKLSDVK